uniref:Uncharacterized protein n=1 Tax=Rhizophora mucronata TaxID=61149 RepID=A0A2P2NXG0_RHIMU
MVHITKESKQESMYVYVFFLTSRGIEGFCALLLL